MKPVIMLKSQMVDASNEANEQFRETILIKLF